MDVPCTSYPIETITYDSCVMSQQIASMKLWFLYYNHICLFIIYFISLKYLFFFFSCTITIIHFFFFFFGPLEMKRINKKIILLNLPQLVYLHKHYNKISFCITSSWYDVCDFLDSLGFTLFYMS